MQPIDAEILAAVIRHLPCYPWSRRDLKRLVDAKHAAITDLRGLLNDVACLMEEDLGETPLLNAGRSWPPDGP